MRNNSCPGRFFCKGLGVVDAFGGDGSDGDKALVVIAHAVFFQYLAGVAARPWRGTFRGGRECGTGGTPDRRW